jgi:hypothetical protein
MIHHTDPEKLVEAIDLAASRPGAGDPRLPAGDGHILSTATAD